MIASIALFVCFSAAGKYYSDKKSKKALFFSSLCEFNGDYIKEMRFSRRHIAEILSEKYASASLNALLQKVKNSRLKNEEIKNEFVETKALGLVLSEKEKSDVSAYFFKLGKSDAFSQIEECMRYGDIFKKYLLESEATDKKYGTLYKKLGVVFGLIAFVIII